MKQPLKDLLPRWGYEIRKRPPPLARFNLPLNRGTVERLFYFKRMFDRAGGIAGDVAECGTGKAKSFQMLALLAHEEGRGRHLWGFDSFEGYPEVSPEDESPRNLHQGDWKAIEAEDVLPILRGAGLSQEFLDQHVTVVKGFFEDALAKTPIERIALLHLDVNLYRSYQVCLNELFPKVAPGGVVMFDEYLNADEAEKCPGAKKAIDEFFSSTPYRPVRDASYGKYFLVKE